MAEPEKCPRCGGIQVRHDRDDDKVPFMEIWTCEECHLDFTYTPPRKGK